MRNVIAAVVLICACVVPAQAQTFEQFVEGAKQTGLGYCKVRQKVYVCSRIEKNDKVFFVIYSEQGRPDFIIRQEDSEIVWRAGVEV